MLALVKSRQGIWADPPEQRGAAPASGWHVNAKVGPGRTWVTACGGSIFRESALAVDAEPTTLECAACYSHVKLPEPERSSTPVVRNPLLALPSMAKLQALDPASREALRGLLMELRADAHRQAERSWRKHKGPMAAYWKAVAVYAGHIARALR